MDLDSLENPDNSHCYISSPLNNNSNTNDTEITKLNESTLINVEQNKTKYFKIDENNDVELSKPQVPVKQIIKSTSVVNVPKLFKINLNPHCISSSLNISSSTSGTKVTELNESISTKLQEQNKIGDIHDVEISKQQKPVNQIIATASGKNENNIYPHKINSSLNNSSTTDNEVTKLNESISTIVQEQKKTDVENENKIIYPQIISSSLNNSSTTDNEVTKLNESILTVVQEQKKTDVENENKIIYPQIISSSLNNSSTTGNEVTKLNESISTIVQERKKTDVENENKIIYPQIISSSLNNSSTTGNEVTKLNESISTIVQERKTDVKNKNKIIYPQIISSSLNNTSSTTGNGVTKLNKSISTIIQERTKTGHFKVGNRNNVEISRSNRQVLPLKRILPAISVVNSSMINFRNSSSLLNNNNKKPGIEVPKLNKSTSAKVLEPNKTINLKIIDNINVEKSQQQIPIKNMIKTPFIIGTPMNNQNNVCLIPNTYSLNLEKIAVPQTIISNVKILPSVMSAQIKKPSTFSIIPSITRINPTNSILKRLQPKLNPVNVTNNKCISTLKPGFRIISPNNLNPKIILYPQQTCKYVLTNVENRNVTNLPTYISKPPMLKPLNAIIPVTVVEKFNTIEEPKIKDIKSKFVVNFKEFQDQRYKALPIKEKTFLEKFNVLFESNTNFQLPQKRSKNSFTRKQKRKFKSHTGSSSKVIKIDASVTDSKHNQQEKELSSLNKNKNLSNFGDISGQKKHVPHTIISKDVINNHANVVIVNDKINNTNINNVKKELCPKKHIPHTITSKDVINNHANVVVIVNDKINNTNINNVKKELYPKKHIPHTITSKDVINNHANVVIVNDKTNNTNINNVKKELYPKKHIPHTITSKDVINNHSNVVFIVNDKINNTNINNVKKELCPKKHIPHTITSKDVINNHANVVIVNDKINNTNINNVKKELCPTPGFIQLSSKPKPIIRTYGPSLAVAKYANLTPKEPNTVKLVPLSTINQSKVKLNTTVIIDGKPVLVHIMKKNDSNSNNTIAKVPTDQIMKMIPNQVYAPKNPKINAVSNQRKICYEKVSYTEPLINNSLLKTTTQKPLPILPPNKTIKAKHPRANTYSRFVECKYEYCGVVAYKPEMIDSIYCSEGCKNLNTKLMLATEKPVVIEQPPENTDLSKKPVIDRKMLLEKLRNRINKRKQNLASIQKENVSGHNDLDEVEKHDKATFKMPPPAIPITVNRSFQKSQNKKVSTPIAAPTTVVQNGKLERAKILSYLQHIGYIPAPKKLFDNPFPCNSNPFKVGQRLEGIDPEHEALFCVMSIVEVCGYRIKLHFDGYPDIYNFWVNANCPDLFYPRWCDQNSRTLQPPKNYNRPFKWTDYLKIPGVMPAPKWNFPTALNTNCITNHSFHTGAKLEALDKLTRTTSKQLICVATIADILGNRIRIHFDGWTDDFDYWTDITSTNIHPVGWCDKNGRSLCPPKGYDDCKGKKPFSWTKYLKETNSKPVPEDTFLRRPLREFTNTMAIEAVDIANPSLVRIAKVVDVKGDEIKILYDGFDTIYAYWIEDDNPNIHPLGWCFKTNHPIELYEANSILWTCKVPGCNGKGNANNSKNTHVFAKDCPYEFESWKKLISGLAMKPDRVKPEDCILSSFPSLKPGSTVVTKEVKKIKKLKSNKIKRCSFKKPKRRINNKLRKNFKKKIPSGRTKTVYKRAVEAMDELEVIKGHNDYTSYGYGSFKRPRLNAWTRYSVLQGIPIFNTTDVRKWPIKEVATFVEIVVSNNYTDNNPSDRIKISKSFINQEIDGDVFLMLTQKDLTDILKIPLGPALKLHNAIVVLRQRISAFDVANGVL